MKGLNPKAPMDLEAWIDDYTAYLKTHGYAAGTLSRRLKHLHAFERFLARARALSLPAGGRLPAVRQRTQGPNRKFFRPD